MGQIFISHVEEDAEVALAIADSLEAAGYSTWCYERNALPGPSYLLQTAREVEESDAVILLISAHSLGSRQVTAEVVRAHESSRPFIPVLIGISHVEFGARQPEWREALGSATSVTMPPAGVEAVMPRICDGLRGLGISPNGRAAAREPRTYVTSTRAPVADSRRPARSRRTLLIGGAIVAVVALVGLIAALAGGGGGGARNNGGVLTTTSVAVTTPSTSEGAGPTEPGGSGASSQTFRSTRDTPVSTSAGSLTVTDASLTERSCPPAGIPGDCLTATGTDRYVVVHLVPAGGGSAALTQVFTMEAHQSSLTYSGGLRAGTYIVSLDSGRNRIEIVYGVVPSTVASNQILLEWPGNQSLLLEVGA